MKIHTAQDLDHAIEALESRKKLQERMLSEQFHTTVEHYKPKNLIKAAFNKVIEPGSTQSRVLKTAGGLGVGLLAKSLFLGKSTSFLGKIAANALKVSATNTVMHNTNTISAWGKAIYKNFFTKKYKPA